jgi:hypothetical protein
MAFFSVTPETTLRANNIIGKWFSSTPLSYTISAFNKENNESLVLLSNMNCSGIDILINNLINYFLISINCYQLVINKPDSL